MNKTTKNLGYGFSALVLSLSAVNLPGILGAANTSAATYDCTTASSAKEVSTAAELETALATAAGKTITLCNSIDASAVDLIVGGDNDIELNGYTLTGSLSVADGVTLSVSDNSDNGTGRIVSEGEVISLKINGGAKITINGGSFEGTELLGYAEGSASTKGTETVTIKGGDFFGVALPTKNSVMASIVADIQGGFFATNPTASGIAVKAGKSAFNVNGGYLVVNQSTITPNGATYKFPTGAASKHVLYTTDNASYGNKLTFTVTDEGGNPVSEDVYAITDTTNEAGTEVSYSFEFNIAGTYTVTPKSVDNVNGAATTVTAYNFVEAAEIKDIYFETAATAETFDPAAYVNAYTGGKAGIANVTIPTTGDYKGNNADGAFAIDSNKVKTVENKEGSATVLVTLNDDEGTTFTFDVYSMKAIAQGNEFYNLATVDADDTITNVNALWGTPVSSDASVVSVARDADAATTVNITPNAVGVAEVTFTAPTEGWVWDNTGDDIKKDGGKVIVEAPTKTFTVINYETKDIALKDGDAAVEALSQLTLPENVTAAYKAGGGTATTYTAATAEDPATIAFKAVNAAGDEYQYTLTYDTEEEGFTPIVSADGAATFKAYGYQAKILEYTPIKYVKYNRTDTVNDSITTATFYGNAASELSYSSAAVATSNDGTKIEFNPTKAGLGETDVTVTETLEGRKASTNNLIYRVYGLDVEEDYYVSKETGTITIAAADEYGEVNVADANGLNYTAQDGAYTFDVSAATDGKTYTIKFSDKIGNNKDVAADGTETAATDAGTTLNYTVRIHVSEAYVSLDKTSAAIDMNDEDKTFTVTVTDSNPDAWDGEAALALDKVLDVVVLNSDGEAVDTITFADDGTSVVDETSGDRSTTFTFTVADDAELGDYTVVFSLKDKNGDIYSNAEAIKTLTLTVDKAPVAATIASGVYTIATQSGLALDVAGGSAKSGANVQTYKANSTDAQNFFIEATEDGYYTIRNIKSGKYLDVAGGNAKDGANVQQYDGNGTASQKWAAFENADGTITFKSALDENLVLDIAGGSTKSGANVQVYTSNGTDAQKFSLAPVEDYASDFAPAEDVDYVIVSTIDNEMGLNVAGGGKTNGTNAQLYHLDGTASMEFRFKSNGDGTYTILSSLNGLALDVAGGASKSGTNVQFYEANGTTSQKWVIAEADEGFTIRSLNGGFYLDIAGGRAKDGTNFQVYTGNNSAAQKFEILPVMAGGLGE